MTTTTTITNTFTVRGVWHHRHACDHVHMLACVEFVPEPDNAHDPQAIKLVVTESPIGALHIGYVPRELTEFVHPLLPLQGWVSKLSFDGDKPLVEVSFDAGVFIPTQMPQWKGGK